MRNASCPRGRLREKGEMCIYFDSENGQAPKIKIGDGSHALGSLHFTGNAAIPASTILAIVNSNGGDSGGSNSSSKLGEFILGTSVLA